MGHEASHDKKGKKKKDYVKKLGAMVQVGYEVEEVPYEDSQGYEWKTTGEDAVVAEAEALFKIVSRGNKESCEVARLQRAIKANRTLRERIDNYPHWKLFFESLSQDAPEWRIAGDWNKDKINRISKVELIQAFIRCLGTNSPCASPRSSPRSPGTKKARDYTKRMGAMYEVEQVPSGEYTTSSTVEEVHTPEKKDKKKRDYNKRMGAMTEEVYVEEPDQRPVSLRTAENNKRDEREAKAKAKAQAKKESLEGAPKNSSSPDEAKWKAREDKAKKKAEDKRRALENQ